MTTDNESTEEEEYIGNIWGWKWSWISLIIICIFLLMAVCRYIIVQPDQIVSPDYNEQLG